MSAGELRILGIRSEDGSGRGSGRGSEHGPTLRRIVADVDGHPLWFESPDVALRPTPEAFASAMLPAALARGANLVVDAPLDADFVENLVGVMDAFARWWGYAPVAVRSLGVPPAELRGGMGTGPAPPGTALCFSGGADSFYTLLCGEEAVDALVFVHGFDIPLTEATRASAYRTRVDRIALAVGARPIGIRTNVREHPASRAIPWGRSHGGALAALGHALPEIPRLLVAASYPVVYSRPWGSRWDLDRFWSSAETKIVHHGADQWRADKVRRLADEPLARAHLRVCLENRGDRLNCSRCEKCVRTMLVLAQCGVLDRFATFDDGGSLAACVAGLRRLSRALGPVYADFLARADDPELRDAIRDLLARVRRRERKTEARRERKTEARRAWKRIRRFAGWRAPNGASAERPASANRPLRSGWSDATLLARIADPQTRERHAAASPDKTEIGAYAQALGDAPRDGLALVLGMTPELRRLALDRFERIVSVEISARSIALYRGWVPPEDAARESIVRADWFDVGDWLARPVAAILGDGVFGNLAGIDEHRRLLRVLAGRLAPGAPLVVRKALIPRGFDPDAESLPVLLERHRRGELDRDEFGFAVRLLGHHRSCHDPATGLLDNARLFRSCEDEFRSGGLSEAEWDAIRRYRFEGRNCILTQTLWETLLEESGFTFEMRPCRGRDWYRYYPVYACRWTPPRRRTQHTRDTSLATTVA